jgi:hypothetical protein
VQLGVAEQAARQRLRGRLVAQHLLDRVRQQRRIFRQQPALVRVLGEQHRAVRDQVRGRVVAGDDEHEAEAEQLLLRERLPVELRVDQRAHEVVPARAAALLEQHRELPVDRRGRVLDRLRLRAALRQLDHRLRPVEEVRDALVGDADHLADHAARDVARVGGEEIATARLEHGREQLARDRADARLHLADALRREGERDERAQPVVAGRVEALDRRHQPGRADHGALGRPRRRVARESKDVREARHRPEAGRAPGERALVAQLAVDVVEPLLEVGPRPVPAT